MYEFDVFLSHKRLDTADFARTLQTELAQVGGLKCFLDQDADFELGDLMAKVRASRCFVFILSEHILESEWCLLELREALAWRCSVVLLTAHGARWLVNGHIHDFPPLAIIPPAVHVAFANKAIEYNRNFHRASVDQLYVRIFGRPPRALSVEWPVPKSTGEKTESFALDLSTVDLELPPSQPLQLLQGVVSFTATSEYDPIAFTPGVPFHVANEAPGAIDPKAEPVEFVRPSIDTTKPLSLYATATSPYWQYPDREIAPMSWSALLVDAPFQSVQTGRWQAQLSLTSLPIPMEGMVTAGVVTTLAHRLEFPLGSFPTRPEIFLTLSAWKARGTNGGGGSDRKRVSLTAKHVDTHGFSLQISCAGPSALGAGTPLKYEIDRLAVDYLAFEPRLNRSWVHGELWLINTTNTHKEVSQAIHFASDCLSSAGVRNEFTAPPRVYLALSGLDGDTPGFTFNTRVSDITNSGCTITWSLWCTQNIRNTYHPDPTAMAIRWIALPAGEAPVGVSAAHTHAGEVSAPAATA